MNQPSQEQPKSGAPSSLLNVAALFKGCTKLRVSEVAALLSCSENHVVNLVKEFAISGGKSGMEGIDISTQNTLAFAGGEKTRRAAIRISVEALQKFINARSACGKYRPKRK